MTFIGKWIHRVRPTTHRRMTRAHYVESEKLSAEIPVVVTRCGRDMPLKAKRGELEEFVARTMEPRCVTCRESWEARET